MNYLTSLYELSRPVFYVILAIVEELEKPPKMGARAKAHRQELLDTLASLSVALGQTMDHGRKQDAKLRRAGPARQRRS